MGIRLGKLETNQICQRAGPSQSSGREKVTVTKRVSDESQSPVRAHHVDTEKTSRHAGGHGDVNDKAPHGI